MTNYEKIKNMSVGELIDFLANMPLIEEAYLKALKGGE